MTQGVLYVVATPIGNLEDLSARAIETLKAVDWIAAEDTRHTEKLCQRYQIQTPKIACHTHNEHKLWASLLRRLESGQSGALVSDAGTPLICDPGFALITKAHEHKIKVCPIPGPTSPIAALSVSGLPPTPFTFMGFLPNKSPQRLGMMAASPPGHTVGFFETPHRLVASLDDMLATWGPDTQACIARELTKQFEQVRQASLGELRQAIESGDIPVKGEFVVLISIPERTQDTLTLDIERYLEALLEPLGAKKASECISRLLDCSKNTVYKQALDLKNKQ